MADLIDRGVSLSDQATAVLRRQILEGVYLPGQRLVEVELAAAFRISRAPLREALRGLAKEGVVVHRANKGFFVPAITLDDASSLYEYREAIETAGARWAAERITREELQDLEKKLAATEQVMNADFTVSYPRDLGFHWSVIKAAHSPMIEERVRVITHQLQLLRQRSAYAHERAIAAYQEHVAIAAAIRIGDADKAEEAMRTHLSTSRRLALSALQEALSRQNREKARASEGRDGLWGEGS
jgi:DNA-binding GntR family transcriptional regulator